MLNLCCYVPATGWTGVSGVCEGVRSACCRRCAPCRPIVGVLACRWAAVYVSTLCIYRISCMRNGLPFSLSPGPAPHRKTEIFGRDTAKRQRSGTSWPVPRVLVTDCSWILRPRDHREVYQTEKREKKSTLACVQVKEGTY